MRFVFKQTLTLSLSMYCSTLRLSDLARPFASFALFRRFFALLAIHVALYFSTDQTYTHTKMSVLGPSLAGSVKSSKGLYKMLKPLADRYASLAGYRAHGLRYDDILIEENLTVKKVSSGCYSCGGLSTRRRPIGGRRERRLATGLCALCSSVGMHGNAEASLGSCTSPQHRHCGTSTVHLIAEDSTAPQQWQLTP